MEEKHLALAQTSPQSFNITPESNPSQDTEKEDLLKCLKAIEKITNVLKFANINDTFIETLEKLFEVVENSQREGKLDLINTILGNIFEATTDELDTVQQDFKKILHSKLDKKLIVDDDKIEEKKVLGAGAFGVVSLGLLMRPNQKSKSVAIKRSKESCYRKLIQYEASILSRLDHENILKIFAINKSGTKIAIELMQLGHLGHAAERYKFSKENVLKILRDVANGMEYLSQKKYLHRDLACRNVFLNAKKQCKIGDFAFCVYVGDTDGRCLETKFDPKGFNISPDTYLTKEFRVETDIWAMGMLIWEFSYMTEYANILQTLLFTKISYVKRFMKTKEWMPKPSNLPKPLYLYVMEKVLNEDPGKRPTFSDIKAKIAEFIVEKH